MTLKMISRANGTTLIIKLGVFPTKYLKTLTRINFYE